MKTLINALRFTAGLSCLSLPLFSSANTHSAPTSSSLGFHFEAGLTYASGLENVMNQLETNFAVDRDFVWPIGLKLTAYARTADGFGFGGGIGPCSFIQVRDDHHYSYHHNNDQWSYIIPVFADVRYYFPLSGHLAPYAKIGVVQPISGGDQIGSGTPGPLVGIGAQVWQHRVVSIGIEVGYDASKVKVKSGAYHTEKKVRPTEFTFSVYASY